jgi:drug/metabolite transporter (DMT)-like permease
VLKRQPSQHTTSQTVMRHPPSPQPFRASFKTRGSSPAQWKVILALVAVQCIFGGGAVIGKIGLPAFNPLLFAFIRELCAGPILFIAALAARKEFPTFCSSDTLRLICAGFALFLNQAGFIVGEKLANANLGAAWQPVQAIWALVGGLLLKYEVCSIWKLVGIFLALGGAVFMVVYGTDFHELTGTLEGNACFFVNTVATACYVLLTKPLLGTYHSLPITAVAYLWCALLMGTTYGVLSHYPTALHFLCNDCTGGPFAVPTTALLPLAYWVVFNSVVAYALLTWANQHVVPSKVLVFAALQPLTACLLSVILIEAGFSAHGALVLPGLDALGAIPIVLGLAVLSFEASAKPEPQFTSIRDGWSGIRSDGWSSQFWPTPVQSTNNNARSPRLIARMASDSGPDEPQYLTNDRDLYNYDLASSSNSTMEEF